MPRKKSILNVLVRKGLPTLRGQISGLPFSAPVEVLRDKYGIPHIFAQNEQDLFMAQGFVHAQDRLWQMETIRRVANGTLAEIAGEEAAALDIFIRLAGFNRLKNRAISTLSEDEKKLLEAYVSGINSYITLIGKKTPLEFRPLKFAPSPWKIDDIGGSLSVNAWFLQTNYLQELLAILRRKTLTIKQWNEIFPSYPGEKLPEEDFFTRFKNVKIGNILPEALAYYSELSAPSSGSNNWVVAKGEKNLPLLANDPHMGMMVPQIWYFCHLHCPTLNVCGTSLPGSPGIVLGRNDHVAWGVTNVMTDCVDLYVIKVNPQNPTRYYIKNKTYEMEVEEVTIPVAGGKKRSTTIYHTIQGTVITRIEHGIDAVVTLKWYGTLKDDVLKDTTLHGFLSLMRAKSVEEAFEACGFITTIGQNFVFSDIHGNIGWHTTGAVPLRKGYSGWVPADGSSGIHDWTGFLPYNKMPHSLNPPERYIVTANHKIVSTESPHPITYAWCAPYRYERIVQLVKELKNPGIKDFQKIQMDNHSLQAEQILSKLLNVTYSDPLAKEAVDILKNWDCKISTTSAAALIFNVFLVQFAQILLSDILGEGLQYFLFLMPFLYTAVDKVLQSDQKTSTISNELLKSSNLNALCEQALSRTISFISETLGTNRKKWSWGKLHTYHFKHPGGKKGLAARLLNRGPYPASGNGFTVNAAVFNPAHKGDIFEKFEATTIPSMRMISSLDDPNATFIIGPMGQSGQPGSKHYDDMIEHWIRGELVPLPLMRNVVEKIAVNKLELTP